MSEWWTYDLSNFLLFSPRTYDRLLEAHNAAYWPWQIPALLSGLTVLILAARDSGRRESTVATSILAIAWLWVGWSFHLQSYAPINWAARWLAGAFALQAVLLVATEALRREAAPAARLPRLTGLVIAGFALLGLPLLERLLGRPWPQVEVFGIFPDATALATLGLLLARGRIDAHLLAIPFASCVIGAATLLALERPDAAVVASATLLGGFAFTWKAVRREKHR